MGYQSSIQRYQENRILTATPGDILIALYDGALRFSQQARQAIERGDPASKGLALNRVMAIVGELACTLNHDRAPELCRNLNGLYTFMLQQLQRAGLTMAPEPLDEVISLLTELRTAWQQAVQQAPAGTAPTADVG